MDALLLQCVYAVVQVPHALPLNGGMLDQPPAFLEALKVFSTGAQLYRKHGAHVRDTLRSLLPKG